jgi:uncharacterized protein YndB with AHSA1/START domain
MAQTATQEVTVTREFETPTWRVWEAWTEPDQFAQWFMTPPYETPVDTVKMDLREGGRWEATQVNRDTGEELQFAGEYLAIDPPRHLVLTFDDPANPGGPNREEATVDLVQLGDGRTELTFRQSGHLPPEQYRLLAAGYNQFFDRLEKVVTAER